MAKARKWIGNLLLHSPAFLRSLRNVPILGDLIHRVSHRILPVNETFWVQVESGPAKGIFLELNPRTGDQYLRGKVEVATQKALKKKLLPGMVFYDLGANIGFFSLLAARLVGESGRVFAFEPDAEIATRLRRNVAQNGFSNVTVIEAGIWSATETVHFVAADGSSLDRGIGKFVSGGNNSPGAPVSCVALDDFIQTAPAPDAIKCDVEGAEVLVLQGAEKLLQTRHPWIICEMHSETNDRMVREFLGRAGYRIESIDDNHISAAVRQRPTKRLEIQLGEKRLRKQPY